MEMTVFVRWRGGVEGNFLASSVALLLLIIFSPFFL